MLYLKIAISLLIFMVSAGLAAAEAVPWAERIKVSGDVRYREQFRSKEGSTDRHRGQIRARLGVTGKVNDQMQALVRLATGEAGNTTASANQTLGDGGNKKSFWLDYAFVEWKPTDRWTVDLGKMTRSWWVPAESDMVFNQIYTPEGVSAIYSCACESAESFIGLHSHWLKERASATAASAEDANDSGFLGVQAGKKGTHSRGYWKAAIGAATMTNLRDHAVLGDSTGPRGNTSYVVGTTSVYQYKYDLASISAEYNWQSGGSPWLLWVDLAQNTEISHDNKAYSAGLTWGTAKIKDGIELAYLYRHVEADAVLAVLTDDAFGDGNTNSRGHVVSAAWGMMENGQIKVSYYQNETTFSSSPKDYKRANLDFAFKF